MVDDGCMSLGRTDSSYWTRRTACVRAVIGSTGQDDGALVGFGVFDAAGNARAWLLDEDEHLVPADGEGEPDAYSVGGAAGSADAV